MAHYQLEYGAMDFIHTAPWTFLENNPSGMYGFVEIQSGLEITKAIVDRLCEPLEAPRPRAHRWQSETVPYLLAPLADPHLRLSFLGAMREHVAETGRTEADGLPLTALEDDGYEGYTAGLRGGLFPWPAIAKRVPDTVLWWIDTTGLDGPEYIGRVAMTRPVRGIAALSISVRPSRRGEGHGSDMLAAALPLAFSRGLNLVRLAVHSEAQDLPAPSILEACGGVLTTDASGRTQVSFAASQRNKS